MNTLTALYGPSRARPHKCPPPNVTGTDGVNKRFVHTSGMVKPRVEKLRDPREHYSISFRNTNWLLLGPEELMAAPNKFGWHRDTTILRSTPAQSGPTFNGFGDKFAPKLDSSTQINGRKWLYVIVNGLETLLPHSTDI